jgi:hypothetical protein
MDCLQVIGSIVASIVTSLIVVKIMTGRIF